MQSRTSSPAIRRDFERVPQSIIKQAAAFPASVLADVAGRRGTLDGRIQPLSRSTRLAGAACTVEVRPGDNLMIHAALAIAQPGDVIVVDGKGDRSCALMGAIMMTACKALGIAGVILDGSHRDTEEILALGYPVYSTGSNPNGPTKNIPGRINWPICCGGVTVNPGDLVVGDGDGVVVIAREHAESLLPLAAQKVEEERARIADIVSGRKIRPAWLEGSLRTAGLLGDGETL
jgi:4-hydroxy-4-methyl-2-oxoglutarate aldolase